ncbi:MAG TPA: Rieske 2Fe-2S domain-containing protein [Chloroflexota bacterium]|jgi:5,5'-dehydrodivanillate O-demethylase
MRATSAAANHGHPAYVYVGPDTLGGRYLRRFWHPVYVAADLQPGHAKPLRILGADFTLYRGEDGAPHLVAPRCAHRGTQLSTGWVEGDCIRCFYHGWKYDSSGQCVEMPAEDASFPPKVRIASYPTEEYLGLIFAYLGDGEAPPLPRWPEIEAPGVLETSTYVRHCSYFNSLENGIDEVHVNFAHRASGFSDFGLNWDVPLVSAEETDYGICQYGRRANGVLRVTPFVMPNVLYIKGSPDDAASGWADQIAWRVPLDDDRHQSFNVRLVHIEGAAAERHLARMQARYATLAGVPSAREMADAILAGRLRVADAEGRVDAVNIQDHVAQEGQGAIADRVNERLGRSDVAIILLRKIYEREVRALRAGRPLKEWARPARLEATAGV